MNNSDYLQFMENVNLLFENTSVRSKLGDIIESPMFLKSFKKNLPKTFAKYGAVSNTPLAIRKLSSSSKLNKPLTKYIHSNLDKKSKNLKVSVYSIADIEWNAFTIPGIHLGMKHSELTLVNYMYGTFKIGKYNFKASPSANNKVLLTSDIAVEPLIIMTSGMARDKLFTNEEKMAVILHEVGHWSSGAATYQKLDRLAGTFTTMAPIMLILSKIIMVAAYAITRDTSLIYTSIIFTVVVLVIFWVLIFLSASLSRGAEFEADNFVKVAGKGTVLSDALQKMSGHNTVANIRELEQISGTMEKLSPIIDFITLKTHPNTYRRSKRLLKEEALYEDLFNFPGLAEGMISGISSKIDNLIDSSSTIPLLWAFSSK